MPHCFVFAAMEENQEKQNSHLVLSRSQCEF